MTRTPWEDATVSVLMLTHVPCAIEEQAWARSAASVLDQDVPVHELIVVGIEQVPRRSGSARPSLTEVVTLPDGPDDERVRRLAGCYQSRAAGLQAGIEAAAGAYILLLISETAPVFLRRSAVRTMLMAATRRSNVGMVYADYDAPGPDGCMTVRHLLDHHAGRLRETFDVGSVWLLDSELLRSTAGVSPVCGAADLYDLRLQISERSEVVHVGSRTCGALYTVPAPVGGHDVFDYLKTGEQAQGEYERALTEHLQRIGADLRPRRFAPALQYTPVEERSFEKCIASVVIPVHHRPEFIGVAIESVLAQTVRNIEVVVVVNGGEEDPTAREVRSFLPGGCRHSPDGPEVRLLVVDVNNLGMCLNLGIAAARGKYYIQLDSDDRLKADAVARLLEVFDSDPTIAMVIGSYEVWELDPSSGRSTRRIDIPVVTHEEWTDENGPNNLLRTNGAGAPRSALVKAIKDVGWFSINDSPDSRNYGEDYDLVLRISEHYRIGRVREPIYDVIRHPGGTDHSIDRVTIDRNDNAKDFMRLEALRRRRALNSPRAPSEAGATGQCPPAQAMSL